ncbi:MAG: hypothetical protein KatS3mg058_4508 [Roseiflexus sp.]|jgi:hypothetical protein|nr:MAG: hypothetical protein KatS3mg058_4508 [Roseiflexus sp.]
MLALDTCVPPQHLRDARDANRRQRRQESCTLQAADGKVDGQEVAVLSSQISDHPPTSSEATNPLTLIATN